MDKHIMKVFFTLAKIIGMTIFFILTGLSALLLIDDFNPTSLIFTIVFGTIFMWFYKDSKKIAGDSSEN